MAASRGGLFVISAASGCGKTTLTRTAMARIPGVIRSVTYTTRGPRPEEEDGRDYHFVSSTEFERRRARGEFLESALVHGHLYGTSRRDVEALCERGLDVFLVIDVQGAASLRQQRLEAVYIFILPPSLEELERRLRQRSSEDGATRQRRLANARQEILQYRLYDYVIVNDLLETATAQLQAIILAERCRVDRLRRDLPIFAQLDGWGG
ncbi:MAG: guanylate kinase [Candidatus Entotheonellia bacterium]